MLVFLQDCWRLLMTFSLQVLIEIVTAKLLFLSAFLSSLALTDVDVESLLSKGKGKWQWCWLDCTTAHTNFRRVTVEHRRDNVELAVPGTIANMIKMQTISLLNWMNGHLLQNEQCWKGWRWVDSVRTQSNVLCDHKNKYIFTETGPEVYDIVTNLLKPQKGK